MPRNFSRLVIALGAALLAGAPALHAQQSGTPVRGDVDGDGRVTAADARIVSDYLVGKPVPAGANVRERGDVNGDGRITSVDAAIIARAAAGRDMSRFPVGQPVPQGALAIVECAGDVRAHTVSCGEPGAAGDARGNVLIGGQGLNVQLTSSTPVVDSTNHTFTFNVTVQNLLKQAMAADSGTGLASGNGVRVFFNSGPTTTVGTGLVTVNNADGTSVFLAAQGGQPYFQYAGTALGADGILSPQETSSPRSWQLKWDPGVSKFTFIVYLSTELQFPAGWVDITPPPHANSPYLVPVDTVVAGRTLQLTATVRNGKGNPVGAPVNWTHSINGGIDSVTAAGLVFTTVGANKVDSVTATSGVRKGTVGIVVTAPWGANSVISALPLTMTAGDSSLVTVQVKDGFGRNVTTGGDAVSLTTSLGTLVGTTTAATVTPIDNGNGTYKAWLKSTGTGTANLTGMVLGNAIGTTASVSVTAAAPALVSVTSTTPQNGTIANTVGSPPAVHVTDAFGNAVAAGIPVKFKVTGGGGKVANGGPVADSVLINTNGSGNAAVTSWTLGGVAPGPNQLTITALGGSNPFNTTVAYVPPVLVTDSSQVMGNTKLDSLVTSGVLANDFGVNGAPLAISTTGNLTTARLGTLSLGASGKFTYLPPAGNVLVDSVQYTVGDGHLSASAYIRLRFVGKVWYVDNTFGGAADGRDVSPFTSVGAAATAAGVNDSILVRTGSGATTGGTLKAGQLLYGQGASAPFTTTLNSQPVTLLAAGSAPSIGALTLGTVTGNTLRGFTSSGGITGNNFGTLTVSEVGVNNPGGQALSLTTGTLSGSFTTVISGGGTNNVLLSGVAGTSTLGAAGNTLSGATADAIKIDGGGGSFTYLGSITNSATLAVNVTNKTGGTVTFSGDINPAAAGAGIAVTNNTGGSVTFSGANKKISSAAASGVSITGNAAAATIAFTGGGLAIASTTGTPFTATGAGTVEVSGSGNTISVSGAAPRAVNLSGITIPAGGMTFASIGSSGSTTASTFTATSVATSGGGSFTAGSLTVAGTTGGTSRGIEINSSSAPFTFTTASVAGTGGEGIYLNGNTGAVAVNGGSVATTTGDALAVSAGSANVTVVPSLTKTTAGRVASVASHTGGTVTVSGALSCTGSCTGILANANSGGTIDFTNATQTVNTSATASAKAVTLSSNTGATIDFTGGSLAITSGSGNGFDVTGGGTVNVTGSANTITSAGGVALNVTSTTIGASGLNFRSISANGGTNGIVLNSTGASGGLTISGTGAANSGGTIQNQTGVGIALTSTFTPKFNNVRVLNTVLSGIQGNSVTNFEFTNGSIDQSGDGPTPGASQRESNILFFDNANTTSSVNVTGTVTITGNTFSNALNTGVWISNQGASTISNLVISNNTFTTATADANAAGGGILIDMQGQGTNITKATLDNNHINNSPVGPAFLMICGNASLSGATSNCGTPGDATNIINITNNVIVGQVGNPVGSEGIVANMNGRGQGNFNVSSNSVTRTDGRAMAVSAFGQVRMTATVANNTIVSTPLFSGTNLEIGADSTSGMASFASYTATVTGNNVSGHDGVGIYSLARGSSDTLRVKLISNTVAAPISVTSARAGIRVDAGSASGRPVVCARIESNTTGGSNNGGGSISPGINFREQTVSGANFGTLQFHNLSPSSGATKAQAETFVSGQNPGSTTGTFGTGGAAALQSTPTYESCSLP
jgi:hypothetical protein